jgi:DNA polymerase V
LAVRLEHLEIDTPLKLRDADPSLVRDRLGVVVERLVLELRGVPCQHLVMVSPANKSIVCSRSFGQAVATRQELAQAVSVYTERAAMKLRRQGLATTVLQVFVTTNPFKPQERQYRATQTVLLLVASADTAVLLRAALRGLASVWRDGYRYKKAGVMFSELVPSAPVQVPSFRTEATSDRLHVHQISGRALPLWGRIARDGGRCAQDHRHRQQRTLIRVEIGQSAEGSLCEAIVPAARVAA